jgi:hypothetical protein
MTQCQTARLTDRWGVNTLLQTVPNMKHGTRFSAFAAERASHQATFCGKEELSI